MEIAVVELLSTAANGRVMVDGIFPGHVLKRVSATGRMVFPMADMDAVRRDLDEVGASGFRWIMRDREPDWENIRREVERHFQLPE